MAWSCTDVIETEGFFGLSEEVLCKLLKHDELHMPEEADLYHAVVHSAPATSCHSRNPAAPQPPDASLARMRRVEFWPSDVLACGAGRVGPTATREERPA